MTSEKIKMLWEISKEIEEEFRKNLKEINKFSEEEIDELFKLIRGAEYRRGKEDRKENKDEKNKSRD